MNSCLITHSFYNKGIGSSSNISGFEDNTYQFNFDIFLFDSSIIFSFSNIFVSITFVLIHKLNQFILFLFSLIISIAFGFKHKLPQSI